MAKQVVILGAGPCGLWAAWELAKSGRAEVTLIEKEDRPGGLCRTNARDGFRFDLGGHRFITANQDLAQEVCGIMGPRLLISERKSRIYWQGGYYHYPVEPKDLLHGKGLENLRMAFSLLSARVRRALLPRHRPDLASWLKGEYGTEIYKRFFLEYTTKVWGMLPERLSAAWAAQRIPGFRTKELIKGWFGRQVPESGRSFARQYFYPHHGMGELFDVLTDRLREKGVRFSCSTKVTGLRLEADRARVVTGENAFGKTEFPCDVILSTIPLPELVASMGLNRELQASLPWLKYRAVRFLNLMLDRGNVFDQTWTYVPEQKFIFARLQEPKKRSPYNAPPGKTSLMLEIPCDSGDTVWNMALPELLQCCKNGLHAMGLGDLLESVTGYFDTAVECGYPVSMLGTPDHRLRILQRIGQSKNIITCGRQGAFSYLFMDQAMEMGAVAAKKALDWDSVTYQQLYGSTEKKGYIEGKTVIPQRMLEVALL